jgi:hypothetical protein
MDTFLSQEKIKVDNNIIKGFGKTFYYFESSQSLKIEGVEKFDALIIDAKDLEYAKIIIKKIRSHSDPEFYLKPIYLINNKASQDPYIKQLSDGIIISFDQLSEIINDINLITSRIARIEISPSSSFETQIIKKTLNYLFTRDVNKLIPLTDVNSTIGYCYPAISVNFDSFEEIKALEILEWAEKENLIWPDFHDRVYLCSNCKGGHLSFREICPKCDSANIISEDLVHHFPCGYIGPISDFRNKVDTALSCSKCSKSLRHIGVDYDKPSVINHCQNCNQVFQDYLVKAKCFQCKTDTDVQFLVSKNINVYKLTKKGRNAAIGGIYTSDYALNNDIEGTIDFKTFSVMMHYEQERMKSNPTLTSNLFVIYFDNIFDLYRLIKKSKEKSLLIEFATIIRNDISSADFICINNPSVFSVCLNDIELEKAKIIAATIIDKIKLLVKNNFERFELNAQFEISNLSKEISFEKQIQTIIKELTEKQ